MTEWLPRFLTKVRRDGSGCHLWTGAKDRCGYGRFGIAGVNLRAHRVMFEHVYGPIPAGLTVLHSCDTPACVNPDHLRAATHAENMADMARKGRADSKLGARNGHAKLSASQVAEIRNTTAPAAEAAQRFGVHWATIYKIRAGRSWSAKLEGPRC